MTSPSGAGRSLTRLWATTALAIIGCTWAFAIAKYGGPDEPAHVIRAAAVAHGDLLGEPVAGLEPGYRKVTVAAPLAAGDPACFRHDEDIPASCATTTDAGGTIEVATSAGTAPPWYYLVVGILARLLSSGTTVVGFRMAAVIAGAVVLGQAMARCRGAAARPWLVAAITPSAWFLGGVVGTSGIAIALVVLALVEAVAILDSHERPSSLLRVTVPLAVCLALRPAAITDVALVALFVAPATPRPLKRRTTAALAAPFVCAGAVTLAWTAWAGLVLTDRRTADHDTLTGALTRSLKGIPTTVHQAVGALGWNEFDAPVVAEILWCVTLAVAVWWVARTTSGRWWHVRWVVVGLLLPTLVEVIVHRRIGAVWQGRYSIPFAIGGVLYAARGDGPPRRITGAVLAGACVAEVLTLWQTLRRYTVGLHGSITMRGSSWSPVLDAWLLLALNAAAIVWLATIAWRSADDVAEDVDEVVGRAGVVVDRQAPV